MKTTNKKTLTEEQLQNIYCGNHRVLIVESKGEAYACDEDSWNGECWDAWQIDEDYRLCNECRVFPIYEPKDFDEDGAPDTWTITGYDVREV